MFQLHLVHIFAVCTTFNVDAATGRTEIPHRANTNEDIPGNVRSLGSRSHSFTQNSFQQSSHLGRKPVNVKQLPLSLIVNSPTWAQITPTVQAALGHAPAGQIPAGPAGQAPAGQAPAGQAPAGQAPAGQAPAGQAQAPAGYVPAEQITAEDVMIGKLQEALPSIIGAAGQSVGAGLRALRTATEEATTSEISGLKAISTQSTLDGKTVVIQESHRLLQEEQAQLQQMAREERHEVERARMWASQEARLTLKAGSRSALAHAREAVTDSYGHAETGAQKEVATLVGKAMAMQADAKTLAQQAVQAAEKSSLAAKHVESSLKHFPSHSRVAHARAQLQQTQSIASKVWSISGSIRQSTRSDTQIAMNSIEAVDKASRRAQNASALAKQALAQVEENAKMMHTIRELADQTLLISGR